MPGGGALLRRPAVLRSGGEVNELFKLSPIFVVGFGFGFITGSCEKERLKVRFIVHQTISMTDSMTVGVRL